MAYIYKRGRLYWIGYKRKGRWIQESTNSEYKDVARARLRARELRADREDPEPISLAEFAREYLEHKRRLGHRAVDRDEDSLGHLLPYFKGKALHEITREGVEKYIDLRLAEGAAPGTVQREITFLKALLNRALRWGRVDKNPAARLSVKGANARRDRVLDPDEMARLLQEASPQGRDVIELAILTGMRKGEIRQLRVPDCDFTREEIRIRQTKAGEPRIVPMHPRVREILQRRCKGNSSPIPLNPKVREIPSREEKEARPVFSPAFHRAFDLAVRQAGLRDLRFHDLRRTAASYLIMSGADPKSVQEILGHKDMRMTMDVYTRVSNAHVREAVGRLRLPALGEGSEEAPGAKPSYNRLTVGKVESSK